MVNLYGKLRIMSSQPMLCVGVIMSVCLISIGLLGDYVVPYDPYETSKDVTVPPSIDHIMGTDQLGRDLFSRLLVGTKYSLMVSALSVVMSLIIGVPIGAVSGYIGGKLDRVLEVLFDALYSLPSLILALLIAFALGPGIVNSALAICVGFIPRLYRVVRSIALSVKERTFVESEKALGASAMDIISKCILPSALPTSFTLVTIQIGEAMLILSSLGFLGLGIPPPTPEWGAVLGRGRYDLTSRIWWTSTFPGLMIMFAITGFTLLGRGLGKLPRFSIKEGAIV